MTTRTRVALVGLAIAVIVVAAILIGSSSSTSKKQSAASAPPVVLVRGANPVGGIKKLTFNKGDRARFVVDSDVADEVHVHGYDLMRDVTPGKPLTFSFAATKDGIFEIELEGRKRQIASLQVQP
jgi:heme/copper-type cytochrome/quinol oxidase subunit 2